MNDGTLVRDLIPDAIHETGRSVEVRQLLGDDLAPDLADELRAEAHNAAEVVNDRDRLIEELSDLTDVVSALCAWGRARMSHDCGPGS